MASDIQTAVVLVAPTDVAQKPCQLGSFGLVDEVKTANCVVGEDTGLPFSALVKLSVEVDGEERVGAPGVLASV